MDGRMIYIRGEEWKELKCGCFTQIVADGASWIWNLVADYLYDSHQVVDWYHATEHLGLTAKLAFGEGTPQASRWFKQNG